MSDIDKVLDLVIEDCNAGDNITIKEYLIAIVREVWDQGEGFSGKRPFGDSGWEYDLYKPLVKAGLIGGEVDEYGDLEDVDNEAGDKLIFECIDRLGE